MVARITHGSPQSEDRHQSRLFDGECDGTPPWANEVGAVAAIPAAFGQRPR